MKHLLECAIPEKKALFGPWAVRVMGVMAFLFALPLAATGEVTLATMATSITNTFTSVAKMITAGSYVMGLGFSITAIAKFKQHKDNPSQIPIGTPVSLVFIAAALLFLPSILNVAGYTMFGMQGGTVAGPTGSIFTSP